VKEHDAAKKSWEAMERSFQLLNSSFGTSNEILQTALQLQDNLTVRMADLYSPSTDDNREKDDKREKDETAHTTSSRRSTRVGHKDDTRNAKSEEGQNTTKPLGMFGGSGNRENLRMHQALPWEELLTNEKLSDDEVFFLCPSSTWLCL
jgi:hypothetical protein